MVTFIIFEKKIISRIFVNITLGNFHPKNCPIACLENPGNLVFVKKFKVTIPSGIQKAPMQAFTALCGTKIMAATAILKYTKKNPDYPYFGSPPMPVKKNYCSKKT